MTTVTLTFSLVRAHARTSDRWRKLEACCSSCAGTEGRANELWLNDGLGGFVATNGGPERSEGRTHTAAWGDVDGDGDLDLFVGVVTNPNPNPDLTQFPTPTLTKAPTDILTLTTTPTTTTTITLTRARHPTPDTQTTNTSLA